jgi:MFS transporter, DHA1 family, multidrug resistance protein
MPPVTAVTAPAIRPRLLLILALLGMAGPFSLDMYLPAFPAMTRDLDASATGIQLTLTAFLLGMGLGQLVFGALSDRYGRRPPLLIGSAVFVLASIAAMAAPVLEMLIAARLLQGLSAAAGVVIGRAIISDMVSGSAAARIFSIMMTLGSIAPVIAPVLGSLVTDAFGWRAVLGVLALLAALMLIGVISAVGETHPEHMRQSGPMLAGLRSVLRVKQFVRYVVVLACCFGVLMVYISASPFVYQNIIGFSPVMYGAMFGVNAIGLILTGIISAKIALRVPPRRTLGVAIPVMLAMALTLLLLVTLKAPPLLFALPLFGAVSSLGFIFGNTTSLALAEVRAVAGSGSAILGSAQFLLGALVSPLVGVAGETSALPLALVMTASALAALIALLCTGKQNGSLRPQDVRAATAAKQ